MLKKRLSPCNPKASVARKTRGRGPCNLGGVSPSEPTDTSCVAGSIFTMHPQPPYDGCGLSSQNSTRHTGAGVRGVDRSSPKRCSKAPVLLFLSPKPLLWSAMSGPNLLGVS